MVKWATGIGGEAKSEKVRTSGDSLDVLDFSDDDDNDDDNDDDLKSAKKSVGFGGVADDPNQNSVHMDDHLFDLGNMSIAELSLSELNYDHGKGGGVGFTHHGVHHEDTIMEEDEEEEEEKKVDSEENKSMYRMSRIALGHGASFVDHMAAKKGKCPFEFDHENMIAEGDEDAESEEETKKPPSMTPREAVLDAIQTNAAAGNENAGYLSFTHGFAPVLTPVTHFPPEFEVWNELVSNLPYLLSSRKLRQYCDDTSKLPVLDATKLDPIFALRAANVLGFIAHAYWNLGDGIPASKKLPAGLETPWITVSKVHLDRTQGPHFLGFFEQVTANFQFLDGQLPTPAESYNCAWANDTLKEYGSVEYDPAGAEVSNYQPSLFLSGTSEERNFFGVITEFQLVGAPVVKVIVEILEIAERGEGVEELKDRMKQLLKLLEKLTFSTFNKIQQQPKAPHYVDPTVWCKIVAPVAVPITSTSLGPSGTASPMIHVLDAFFGRIKHEQFIGKELKGLFDSFPRNWRNFMIAVQQAPSIGEFVDKSRDTELQGLFGACLRQYAEENGFLGRHKLKMLGYIEVAMKLGRDSTIGGVAGLLKDRAWDNIAKELQVGQNERFAIPLKAGALQHVGRVIPISEENLQDNKRAYQIRIDTKGSGIQLEPGSHVGVLYESSADSIWTTLLAFADGDKIKAKDLGKNYMVDLNVIWRKALIQREEYHDATSYLETPTQLNLETFLKWGELRPASRQMLEMAHRASFSKEIHAILNNGLEATLTFSDVVAILKREGVDLLIKDQANEGDDIDFAALRKNLSNNSNGMNEGGLAGRKSRMTAAAMGGSSGWSSAKNNAKQSVFLNTGIKKSHMKKMTVNSKSFHTVKEKILSVVKHVPKLCELIQPAKFRHYSVASSPLVHPTELHLYVGHLKYDTPSAVIQTSPLLAETQEKVLQRGAASDYLVTLSFPRYYLAIAALASQAGLHINDKDFEAKAEDLEFPLTEDGQDLLKHQSHLEDKEVEAILRRAKTYSGGHNLMKNLITAIKEELKDKPDPRDRRIILKSYSAPRFRLPECFTANLSATEDTVPIIMIAGGTGLAPFRAFWQQLASAKPPANGERHLLLIGQRTRDLMAFEDEIITMVKAGILDVEIIFSRDEVEPSFAENEIEYKSSPGRRGYIDKIIKDPAMYERLSRMMANGAYFYLCGAGAFAKTAVDALPQKELEGMVAENRMVLDIFTSLVQPKIRDRMELSELCQCNDFVGVRKGGEKRLLMVINATVYDMRRFFHLHPGGDAMLKLYCGMDATKAWVAVKHNEAPEVAAMLEMITAEKTLHNVEGQLSDNDKEWYKHGWKAMTMSLLEIQNALSLAFEKNWDSGVYSAAEKDLGHHFVAWQVEPYFVCTICLGKFNRLNMQAFALDFYHRRGKSLWRPKRSPLKGEYFVATHNRLWSLFVPSLLSDDFDEVRSGLGSIDSEIDIVDGMEELEDMPEHRICDAICTLIKQELDKLSANEDSIVMPSDLQSFVEEVRIADDALLESIKLHLIKGLQVFENHKSPLLPAFHSKFFMSVMGIIGELKKYIAKVASLAIAQFGEEHVLSVASSPGLKRGGITLVGSSDLDNVTKEFMDGDQVKTAGVVEAGHDHASSVPKCPMHIASSVPKCPMHI